MAQVCLKEVSKVYPGGIDAVRNVSLEVGDGEFVVLVGPSGCGKSTTLRMIAGLEEVTHGEITIGDRVVNDVPPKDRDIAMVFQNYALYPHMTVYKNMAFGLKLRRYPKEEIDQRVREAARVLEIEALLDRKPKALSGGERQRVALGRAIVRNPQVFLFDEPLSNLDAMLRVQMRAEIEKLHTRLGTTMIYVTHDQVEAMTMGDRIVVMLDGVVQQIATPTELYKKPVNRFVAGFIGSPPMNFLEGRLAAEQGTLRFTSDTGNIALDVHESHRAALESHVGQGVVMGIRPEDLLQNTAQTPVPGRSLTTIVEMVEPLGAETYLYLSADGHSITGRVHADVLPRVGSTHVIDLDLSKAHYFDASSGKAIL